MKQTTVLDVGGLHWATSAPIIESALQRRPGVLAVSANAANQTATVSYDPDATTVGGYRDVKVIGKFTAGDLCMVCEVQVIDRQSRRTLFQFRVSSV